MGKADHTQFWSRFHRWAGRIRRRHALRAIITGAGLGLTVGIALALAAWYTGHGALRPYAAAAGIVGAILGSVAARRRRWGDGHVALFLDGRLGSEEAISTAAYGLTEAKSPAGAADESEGDDGIEMAMSAPALAVVVSHATQALDGATGKQLRTPLVARSHILVPLSAAALVYVSWIPLPPPPVVPPPPPGAEMVTLADVRGLDDVIALSDLNPRDEAQQKRLDALAKEAEALREKLRNGMEKREAQSEIARLRDAITAERLSLGEGDERAGMEAALSQLDKNPDLRKASKALGDRDLTQMDAEMQKLANQMEEDARERAKETLEEAAEAAKREGADDVAKALEEQRKLLDKRLEEADKLKELAKGLGDNLGEQGEDALDGLQQKGDPESQRKLVDSLEKALEGLSEEERKQLAENLRKQAEAMRDPDAPGGMPPSAQSLQDMADALETEEGRKMLEEQLKEMAKPPASDEAERQKQLDNAERGLGQPPPGMPIPKPGGGQGEPGKPGGGQAGKGSGDGDGDGKGGPGPGGDKGDHDGSTERIDGGDLRAHAGTKINQAAPMPGTVMGRAAGRPGETANIQGTGALGQVGPGELGAIDRSEVPEEYREQVGRYFQTQ